MTSQDILALAKKIKEESSTPQEELELLKYLNQGVNELRTFVKDVMISNN